jgi:hypothetical protein
VLHTCTGLNCHVSVSGLTSLTAPGSIVKPLYPQNPNQDICYDSYEKEYYGLSVNGTFSIISDEKYCALQNVHNIKAIPYMCIFVIKHTNGVPTRAKSQIVVLGNLDQQVWVKSDCFSPLVAYIPMIHFLTSLAVQNGQTKTR